MDPDGTQDFNAMFNAYMGAPSMAGLSGGARNAASQLLSPLYDLTNFTSLLDPTPFSDVANGLAAYGMGNYGAGSMSFAGALIPFASGIEIKTATHLADAGYGLWKGTARVGETLEHGKYGLFYKSGDYYFAKDIAGTKSHGRVVWKFYQSKGRMMEHAFEADKFGNKINKHKGPVGRSIPMSQFKNWKG